MNLALADSEFPVRLRFERSFTDDELAQFCADNDPLRVERDANGELIVLTPITTEGGGLEGDVFVELAIWTRADGRGRAFGPSTGFTLPDTSMRSPDAAWVEWSRLDARTPEQRHGFSRIVPDFVIEVRSESDRLKPLREKMATWIANGVKLAWLIDPQRKVVEVYRPNEEPEIHDNPTSVQGNGPVSGFELVTNSIWGLLHGYQNDQSQLHPLFTGLPSRVWFVP